MNIKQLSQSLFWILFLTFLTACGTTPPAAPTSTPTESPTATPTVTGTPIPPFFYTVVEGDTCTSLAATFQVSVDEIIQLNNLPLSCIISTGQQLLIPYSGAMQIPPTPTLPTPFPTFTSRVFPRFPRDGYVMVFSRDEGVYFQDGEKSPIQIASGDFKNRAIPRRVVLSDDHQKVAFPDSRDDYELVSFSNIGAARTDYILFDIESLDRDILLGDITFIPGTHQLFVETMRCQWGEEAPCFVTFYISDTHTSDLRKLADLGLADQIDNYRLRKTFPKNIVISPDGKMVASGTMTGITIYTLDGKIVREHILPYEPSSADDLFPTLSWFSDSSGLAIALPNTWEKAKNRNDHPVPAYTVWRYGIDSNRLVQIHFDPIPTNNPRFSPDGNWIVYMEINSPTVYLGSLLDGHIQKTWRATSLSDDFFFGPDGKYFIQNEGLSSFLGIVDSPPAVTSDQRLDLIPVACQFLEWVDANHYTCRIGPQRILMAEITAGTVTLYDLELDDEMEYYILIEPE